jgi:uncharacterized protein (TIGR03437 family)
LEETNLRTTVTLPKFVGTLFLFTAAAAAQTWDSSGNSMLKGTYYFREVFYAVGDYYGDLSEAVAVYGSLTFSGTGTYTGQVSVFDSSVGAQQSGSISGTYTIAASGYGFISNPLVSGDYVYGMVNQSGIFVGSTTETAGGYNDMFVAAPLASPNPTVSTFKGTYSIAGVDLSSGSPSGTVNYMLQVNPDGVSTLGTVATTVYVGQQGSTKYTQNISGVKYVASGGAMVATFPNSTANYITGQKYLYISPDGNFIFGGSPTGWDMFVGVRTSSTNPSFGGLYYQAGIDQDESTLASQGYANLDTYFGSFSANNDAIIGHQRYLSIPYPGNVLDYTYSDLYSALSNSSYASPGVMTYVVGQNGIRIGSGIGPYLGINVAIPAPSFSGNGVYLNPTGVVNAASYAPFTSGIAPGELITLYGTGLANSTVIAPAIPFPASLGDVQVSIGGVNAPIYYVSPTQVSVIVPYEATSSIVPIQITNNGNQSNVVTVYTNQTSAGVFSQSQNGIGVGAALHQDGITLVTPSNPAQPGETVSVYLTGLGAVNPSVSDGAPGPSSPLSYASNTITADIGGVTATVAYAGLAPGFAGLYQVNLTIPTGLTAGENALDISGPDSYTSEVTIAVGGAATVTADGEAKKATPHRAPSRASKSQHTTTRRKPQ